MFFTNKNKIDPVKISYNTLLQIKYIKDNIITKENFKTIFSDSNKSAYFNFYSFCYILFFTRYALINKKYSDHDIQKKTQECIKLICRQWKLNLEMTNNLVDIINDVFSRSDDIFSQPKESQTSYNNPIYNISKQYLDDILYFDKDNHYDAILLLEISEFFMSIMCN